MNELSAPGRGRGRIAIMARALLASCLVVLVSCGGGAAAPDASSDTGADGAPPSCTSDGDCSDGLFCNGEETCGASGQCAAGTEPCVGMPCDDSSDSCDAECADSDGDGRRDLSCGGDDCDDDDPNRFPGNPEVCDVDDHDEDCDGTTFGFRDTDGDTFPDAACCNGDQCGTDCNDAQPAVRPGLPEACDTLDNDCDGLVDEGALRTFHPDADGDSFGDVSGTPMRACNPPVGHVENDEDCDDDDDMVHPLSPEVCDTGCMPDGTGCVDENCDGAAELDCACTGSETRACPVPGVCASGIETCVSATGTWGACSIAPVVETCDGLDNDCDDDVDEGLGMTTCWQDADGDGFALVGAAEVTACATCPANFTSREPAGGAIDCNDDPSDRGGEFFPGATEVCDRRDNDCSSGGGDVPLEDVDDDGFTAIGFADCVGGFPKTDCQDGNEQVFPGQTRFFTIRYCPAGGTTSGCSGGQCRIPSMGTPCEDSGSFDWDCSGAREHQPGVSGQPCNPAVDCRVDGGCTGPEGPRDSVPVAQCGELTDWLVCICLPGDGSCFRRLNMDSEVLACH